MTELTEDEAMSRLDGVLKAAGVTLSIGGCGCCGSPVVGVRFPDGAEGEFEHFSVDLGGELPRT